MRKILVLEACELSALIAPYNKETGVHVYNQTVLALFANCVANDIAVTLFYPSVLRTVPLVSKTMFQAILEHVKKKLSADAQKKAALITQEFTDDFRGRMAEIAKKHEQVVLMTRSDAPALKGVTTFLIDPNDTEKSEIVMDVVSADLFPDEASEPASPVFRLFEGLDDPAPPAAPDYRRH